MGDFAPDNPAGIFYEKMWSEGVFRELTSPFGGRSGTMRQLHFDLLRLLEDDRQGSHGSRRARRCVLAQAAETLHRLGYRGLRAKGLRVPSGRCASFARCSRARK